MVTLMARRILRETVTRARWLSVVVGFLGVLCASDPFGLRFSFATGLVLLAAALWGYGIILMRQIAGQEPALLQMLASNTVFLTGTGLACLVEWHPLSQAQFLGLSGVAVIGGLAQFLVFEAARLIQASIMATVEYSALPWAFFLGWWFWGDIPPVAVFAGAGLILLAGGILIRGERRA